MRTAATRALASAFLASLLLAADATTTVAQEASPSNVAAFPNAPGAVTITWQHTGEGVYWFVLEQESPYGLVQPDRDKRAWTVVGLQASHAYRYRVCAVYALDRQCSDYVGVTTLPAQSATPPPPPQNCRPGGTSFEATNFPGLFLRHRNFLGEITTVSTTLDRADATFLVRPALNGQRLAVSLESVNYPGFFLRHQNFRLKLQKNDGTDLFRKDASFIRNDRGTEGVSASFESVNYPGYHIRHRDFHVWVEKSDGSQLFGNDATWQVRPPRCQ